MEHVTNEHLKVTGFGVKERVWSLVRMEFMTFCQNQEFKGRQVH